MATPKKRPNPPSGGGGGGSKPNPPSGGGGGSKPNPPSGGGGGGGKPKPPPGGNKPMPGLPNLPSKPVKPKPPTGGGKPKPPTGGGKPKPPTGGGGKPKPPKWPEFENDPNAPPGPTPEGPPDIPGADDQPVAPPPDDEKPVAPPPDETGDEKDPYEEYFKQQEQQRQRNAIATIKALLDSYGMGSLYGKIVEYVQSGYDADAVMALIRTTPEYKQRFPAMEALAKKGRAISEAEYIEYEKTASSLERRYGLPQGMLMGKVTDLLTNEVLATELNDRVVLAAAAAIQAPQDVRDTFQRFYGINQGGLTAYFLDPNVAEPLLQKQFSTALIGREAAAQGVGLDVYGAENLQALGITQEQAREGFGQVAGARELTAGRGDVVSEQQLIQGTLAGDEKAKRDIERAQRSRLGRFEGGGGFIAGQGQTALGSAATT